MYKTANLKLRFIQFKKKHVLICIQTEGFIPLNKLYPDFVVSYVVLNCLIHKTISAPRSCKYLCSKGATVRKFYASKINQHTH